MKTQKLRKIIREEIQTSIIKESISDFLSDFYAAWDETQTDERPKATHTTLKTQAISLKLDKKIDSKLAKELQQLFSKHKDVNVVLDGKEILIVPKNPFQK